MKDFLCFNQLKLFAKLTWYLNQMTLKMTKGKENPSLASKLQLNSYSFCKGSFISTVEQNLVLEANEVSSYLF